MPAFAVFKSADHFYNVTFHELTHWTGHKSRLDRDLKNRFGSRDYTAEELVAELGAAFLCAKFGFDGDLRHAGYVPTWIGLLKADKRAFLHSVQQGIQSCGLPAQLGARWSQTGGGVTWHARPSRTLRNDALHTSCSTTSISGRRFRRSVLRQSGACELVRRARGLVSRVAPTRLTAPRTAHRTIRHQLLGVLRCDAVVALSMAMIARR